MHYLIYKITNKVNGKIYIGKHVTENIDDGYMGSGIAIRNAIKKYGVENFTKEILFDVYGEDLMNFLEEAIVDEAFVARPDTYNMALGGKGGGNMYGKHFSNESKRKMSEVHRGKHVSDETRKKISEACKNKIPWSKGKHLSDEHKRKVSESLKGKGHLHSEETKKRLSEINKGKRHSEEAKRKMSESLKGNQRTAGLRWYNNGTTQTLAKECPEGFVPGRLKKIEK